MTATTPPDAVFGSAPSRFPLRAEAWLVALYALLVAFVTGQQIHLGHINNFAMFRWSFFHLREGVSLYAPHLDHYYDLYQYGPSFALLMAPFAMPPVWLGLFLFNALNVGVFYYAVRRLLPGRTGQWALLLLFFEVLRATQNSETNALAAGLMVLAFLELERGRALRAAAAIAVGTLIKIFPLAAAALALPHRWRWRFGLALAAALALLLLAPLLVTPGGLLVQQYRWWGELERSYGPLRLESVMALLALVLPGDWPNWPVQLLGTALVLLPFAVRRADWGDTGFRRAMLCSLLVYVLLFNHQAESPTFIIAMTGIVAWYLTARRRWYHHAVMAASWVLVSLFSEILPAGALNACCRPWHYKTVPVVLAWAVMLWELLAPRHAALPAAGAAAAASPSAGAARPA
jgi:hypothetical protein